MRDTEPLDILIIVREESNMTYDNEIEKMEQENKVAQIQAKAYIDDFVNDIKKMDKSQMVETAKPQKIKIPFKVKVQRFFNKLNKTLG